MEFPKLEPLSNVTPQGMEIAYRPKMQSFPLRIKAGIGADPMSLADAVTRMRFHCVLSGYYIEKVKYEVSELYTAGGGTTATAVVMVRGCHNEWEGAGVVTEFMTLAPLFKKPEAESRIIMPGG
jgi:hypothetical protein